MKKNLLTIILSVVCGLSIVCSVVSLSVGLSHINNTTINEKVEVIESTLDDLEALDIELDSRVTALEIKVTTLESELAKTNTAIDALDSDVKSLQETKETIEADITSIKADIESLKAKDTDLEGKITTLETTLNSSVEDVKEWVKTNYATIESCEELEDEIRGLINSLDSRVTALETSVNTLNGAIEALEEQVNQNKEKIEELENRINCLEGIIVLNPENVMYSLSEDYSECSAIGHCIYCEEEFVVETVKTSEESTGHYIATFENEAFGTQHMVLNETALTSITSGTITLGNNIDLNSRWDINNGADITLNLNGKTLNYVGSEFTIYVMAGGKITIEDSVGTGLITNSSESNEIIFNNGGTVVINGGNIVSEITAIMNNGTTIINGGNIKVNGGLCGVYNLSGTLEINGGTISSTEGICIQGSATIKGSPILTTGYLHFVVNCDDYLIDLRNYTGTETIFYIDIFEAYTSQITLPEGWSLYEDINGTIPADGNVNYSQVIYAIKNESLN